MSLQGLILGVASFFFLLFLSLAVPSYFTNLPSQQVDVLQTGLLFLGIASVFIGAISK